MARSRRSGLATSLLPTRIYLEVLRQRRGVMMEILTLEEASAAGLHSTDGLWHPGVAYVEHPYRPGLLHRIDESPRRLVEEEQDEFVRLARSLGATRIRIEGVVGRHHAETLRVETPLPLDVPVQVGADAKRERTTAAGEQLELRYDAGRSPAMPDDLVWFSRRPDMQQLARERLSGGLTHFDRTVESREAQRIQASVRAKLVDMGFEIGASSEQQVQTRWSYAVEFERQHV